MSLTLAEGVVTKLKTYLTTNLATKLTALNTEYNDGITLVDMATWYLGEPSIQSVQAWPAGVIMAEDVEITRWTSSFTDALYNVTIVVLVLDQDTETLRKMLYRYIRAVWEVVLASESSISPFHIAGGIPRFSFSPVFTNNSALYVSDAALTVQLRAQET